jgi:hypothetical protein
LIIKGIKNFMGDYIFVQMSAKNSSGNVKIATNFLLGRKICYLRNDVNQLFILFLAHEGTNRGYDTGNDTCAAAQAGFRVGFRVRNEFQFG